MNQEYFEKDLEIMKKHNYLKIANLITFIQDIAVNQKNIEYESIDKEDGKTLSKGIGKIKQWDICYDEEFPDMDIEIFFLHDTHYYTIVEMIDENVKQINETEYEVDLKEIVIKLRTGL